MVKNLQKISFLKSPLLIAALVCFVIALVIPFFAPKPTDVKGLSQKTTPSPTATMTPTPTEEESITGWVVSPTIATATQVPSQATTAPTHSASSGQASPQSQAVETFQVHLTVNGSNAGDVTMQKGQNQCDVLALAKDQGKISSLLMKYDNNLGTYGVYQINGIGKENAIWWVYKINGQSPSQGCSYIKANKDDRVEWEYKG